MTHRHSDPEDLGAAFDRAGLRREYATAWLNLCDDRTADEIVEIVRAWQWEGMPNEDAPAWHAAGWQPGDAVWWWAPGYTPRQATFALDVISAAAPDETTDWREWIKSGLIPDDAVLCLAAGIDNLDRALNTTAECAHNERLRGALVFRAAMNGVNLRALKAN